MGQPINIISFGLCAAAVGMIAWGAGRLMARQPESTLKIEATIVDLGRIDPLDTVVREVAITNRSDQTVVIENLSTSCGCVNAQLDSETIAPGSTTWLNVSADVSRARYDRIHETIAMRSRVNGGTERHVVTVQGQIDRSGDLQLLPARLHAVAARGSTIRRTIKLKGKATALAALPAAIEFDGHDTLVTIEGRYDVDTMEIATRDVELTITIDEATPLSHLRGELRVAISGPSSVTGRMPIAIDIVDSIRANPSHVFVHLSDETDRIEVPVALLRADGSTVPIESVQSQAPISWRHSERNPGEIILELWRDRRPSRMHQATILVQAISGETVDLPLVIAHADAAASTDQP